jgi:ribosomal protein S17E
MKPIYTQTSLIEVENISNQINNQTFHHHYHILYDIANSSSKTVEYKIAGAWAKRFAPAPFTNTI